MTDLSSDIKTGLNSELKNIIQYWKANSVDEKHGGFLGKRDHFNTEVQEANKGAILNTRLLWTFSAIENFQKDDSCRELAERAYDYLKKFFRDDQYQGIFWELDYKGKPVNKRKQIYAQAFAIYALAEYYKLSNDQEALKFANNLFFLIEKHALDRKKNGYLEAFQQDWSPIEDMRLSDKDENSAKTMNTHLHILEAYTNLYLVSGDITVKGALINLIELFLEKFLDPKNMHFQLFFNTDWQRANNVVSYGHDIEAVWLIIEACKAVENSMLLKQAEKTAVEVAEVFLKEAYVPNAGVINEKDLDSGITDEDRHWWPQVEAMVGLDYAFNISGEKKFLLAKEDIWQFTKQHIKDHSNGEWHFRVNKNNKPCDTEDKLSMWKAPYHNSRALMVLLKN